MCASGDWALPRVVLAAIIFGVTLWPTFFMGMSLPLLARALTHDPRQPARWVPLLYGSNTLGAACGSLLAWRCCSAPSTSRPVSGWARSSVSAARLARCSPRPVSSRRRHERVATTGRPAGEPLTAVRAPSRLQPAGLDRDLRAVGIHRAVPRNSLVPGSRRHSEVQLASPSVTCSPSIFWASGSVRSGQSPLDKLWSPVSAFFLLQSAIPVVAAVSLALVTFSVDRVDWADPLWEYLGHTSRCPVKQRRSVQFLGGAEPTPRRCS